jgi:anti-sigma factor (TIGR02949 family)
MSRPLRCQEVVELVTDYLEGALSARDRRRFEAHIAGCEHCTRYLEQLRRTIATVGRLPRETLPDELRDDLLAAFRAWRE